MRRNFVSIISLLLLVLFEVASCQRRSYRVKRDGDDDLGKFAHWLKTIDYDKAQEPENDDGSGRLSGPTNVNISVLVANIRSISEINMQYSVEMFFREYWTDHRLKYNPNDWKNKTQISLSESVAVGIWQPDTFIPNALTSIHPEEGSISHRSLFRLKVDGSIQKSSRLSIEAECNLDLTRYPFDKQVCKLGIESYGYTTAQLDYFWAQDSALQLSKIRLPDFRVDQAFVTKRVYNYATGDYARLYACFVFSRSAGFCFLQLIMPSLAVVFTAWVSMWMDNESSFQDMITILLAIIFLLYSYNESMPKVSYIKAMDIYLGTCFAVAFISLLKIALAHYIRKVVDRSEQVTPVMLNGEKTKVTVRTNRIITRRFLHIFNLISVMFLFIFFVVFCVLFFFVYPFLTFTITDEDCDINQAIFEVDLSHMN